VAISRMASETLARRLVLPRGPQAAKEQAERERKEMLEQFRRDSNTGTGQKKARKIRRAPQPAAPVKAKTTEDKGGAKGGQAELAKDQIDVEGSGSFDLFAAIRSNLALALRRCQKELSKQVTCSRCSAFLLKPSRFIACRHVLCEFCVEQACALPRSNEMSHSGIAKSDSLHAYAQRSTERMHTPHIAISRARLHTDGALLPRVPGLRQGVDVQ
jgi:hypothetical protein